MLSDDHGSAVEAIHGQESTKMNFAGTQLESYDGELTICGVTAYAGVNEHYQKLILAGDPPAAGETEASYYQGHYHRVAEQGGQLNDAADKRAWPEVGTTRWGPDPDDWKVPPSTVDTDLFAHPLDGDGQHGRRRVSYAARRVRRRLPDHERPVGRPRQCVRQRHDPHGHRRLQGAPPRAAAHAPLGRH